jgi:hypothetical protein
VPLEGELDVAAVRDLECVLAGARPGREALMHLLGGLQVELIRVELEPLRIRELASRVDAQQHLVRGRVVLVRVVRIVRCHPRDAHLGSDAHEFVVERLLRRESMVLELEIETVAEQLPVLRDLATGPGEIAGDDQLRDLRAQAPGQADDAVGVFGEQLPIRPGLVMETLEPRARRELDEVLVALIGRGEQGEVEGLLGVLLLGGLGPAIPPEEVALHPEDRLDARLPARQIEVQGPVHDSVVRDRTGAHAGGRGRLEHVADTAGTVQHRVLGMCVQMNETQALFPIPNE